MEILFNGNLIEGPIPWSPNDRAFQYGDGFFETMLFKEGRLPLKKYHLQRLANAAKLYHLELPESEFRFLEENITTLRQINELEGATIRVKLMIWRRASENTGYRTRERKANWMLMVSDHTSPLLSGGMNVGVSEQVQIPVMPWSGIKSLNALPYVMASVECNERKLDDLVILNNNGHVAECIESNLFWRSGDTWFTPADTTGCVRGTMRAYLMEEFNKAGMKLLMPDGVLPETPEAAFTCNATGIRVIGTWDGTTLSDCTSEIESFIDILK